MKTEASLNPSQTSTSHRASDMMAWTISPLACLAAMSLMLCGCLNLKPVVDTSRSFVLTPLPATTPALFTSLDSPVVGIGRVDIPEYLQSKRIAVRKGSNEVQYSETLQWAERLDKGIQRALGANIGLLLGSTNVVLSAWRRSDVQAEIYVLVQRFETDERGQAVLEARWRVMNPGAEIALRAGLSRITQAGPPFADNPDGAAAALSDTVANLSREITEALRGLSLSNPAQSK